MTDESNQTDASKLKGRVKAEAAAMPPAAKADFSDASSHVSITADSGTNYAVAPGDTLSTIALHFYGDAEAWQRIFAANRDQLSDPDDIQPGLMLKIPGELAAPTSRMPPDSAT